MARKLIRRLTSILGFPLVMNIWIENRLVKPFQPFITSIYSIVIKVFKFLTKMNPTTHVRLMSLFLSLPCFVTQSIVLRDWRIVSETRSCNLKTCPIILDPFIKIKMHEFWGACLKNKQVNRTVKTSEKSINTILQMKSTVSFTIRQTSLSIVL